MKSISLYFLLPLLLSLNASAGCLEDATTFAERICGQIQTAGSQRLVDANGQLKAEVSSIVRRIIGSAEATVNARRFTDVYENVLREDLAKELFNVRNCRMKMAEVGRAEACKTPVQYKTCRHADFGISAWLKVEEINRTSIWGDFGPDPLVWCQQLIDEYVSSRSLGPYYEVTFRLAAKMDEKESHGDTLYKHWCTVKVASLPRFAEKTDPRCGVQNP